MSFLAPLLLFGLPLALIPVIIHLIHLLRRRQVPWAAMMFLRKAQKMNKGFSKLRQYLILAFRVLAVLALILTIARPLAGGLLGLTGGAPDSVLILLDRSASMEEQWLATGTSKRQAALQNLTQAIRDAYGKRSKLVLIDSATQKPILLENAAALADLPQSAPTDTTADIPGLMQEALDYMTVNETGRSDVWIVSDLRRSDWDPGSGRWAALRSAFSTLPAVRFHLLSYSQMPETDLGVVIENALRRQSTGGEAELLLDLRLWRRGSQEVLSQPRELPLRLTVNGASSTLNVTLQGPETLLRSQRVPIDAETVRGWGRVDLPSDAAPANNRFYFVFDEPPALKSVIVSEAPEAMRAVHAALSAPALATRAYDTTLLSPAQAAEIAWETTGLVVWQAPFPEADTPVAKQLQQHLAQGRTILFLPPDAPTESTFAGLQWTQWSEADAPSALVDWWRSDTDLLQATRAGSALPVGETEVQRWCGLEGSLVPLARLGDDQGRAPILARGLDTSDSSGAYFLTTLPGPGASSLAREGVVLYALLHRALETGGASLGNARQRYASRSVLGTANADTLSSWGRLETVASPSSDLSELRPLRAGVLAHENRPIRLALNRPPAEDDPSSLGSPELDDLFTGLDWRLLERTLEDERSLTSEVWRTFLWIMAAALVFEALLCLPQRAAPEPEATARASS